MCGRFTLTSTDDVIEDLELATPAPELKPRYNIAPTTRIAVVANREERAIELFRWGLIPRWAKDKKIGNRMINARSETLAEKPSFRVPYKYRRCLILASGFYEWKREGKTRIPHYIRRQDQRTFAMAGLWEKWKDPEGEELLSATIITTSANDLVAGIHNRMPVIVSPADYGRWLHPEPMTPDVLGDILVAAPAEAFEMFAVSSFVSKVGNDDPSCIEPAAVQSDLFG